MLALQSPQSLPSSRFCMFPCSTLVTSAMSLYRVHQRLRRRSIIFLDHRKMCNSEGSNRSITRKMGVDLPRLLQQRCVVAPCVNRVCQYARSASASICAARA